MGGRWKVFEEGASWSLRSFYETILRSAMAFEESVGEDFKVDKMGPLLCNDRNFSNTVGRSKVEGRKELGDVA